MRDWVTTWTSVVFVIAIIAITANTSTITLTEIGRMPARMTSSSAASESASVATSTVSAAEIDTST